MKEKKREAPRFTPAIIIRSKKVRGGTILTVNSPTGPKKEKVYDDPKRLSRELAKRVKLTPDQLARVKGQAGEGLASRYKEDGTLSLSLSKKLAKAKGRAKKFVLYSDQLGRRLYLSKETKGVPLTFDKREALQFFEGFDDPSVKVTYWNKTIPSVKFLTTHS